MKITRARMAGIALGVAIIAGTAFLFRPKPLTIDTGTVTRRALEATVEADGRTRVRARYMVVAPVAGRLERITHIEGVSVRAGEIVARVMPLPLDSEAVNQTRARVDAANAVVLQAAAQVRVANAELDQRRR